MKKRIISLLLLLSFIGAFNCSYAEPVTHNVANVAPSVDIQVQKTKNVDLIFLTDYTGAKLDAIISKVNEVRAELLPLGVNIKAHIINDKVSIAKQSNNVTIKHYSRYLKASYYKTGNYSNPNGSSGSWNNTYTTDYLTYEYITINDGEELPPFSKSSNFTVRTLYTGRGVQEMSFAAVQDEYEIYDPDNYAATKISYTHNTQMSTIYGYWHAYSYTTPAYFLDNVWSLTSIGSQQQNNDVYALDISALSTMPINPDSEKHMFFVSDADSANYSKGWGKAYCFGSATTSELGRFITDNNVSIYCITDSSLQDLVLNKAIDRLDRNVPQDISINGLMQLSANDVMFYGKGKVSNALDNILYKYSDHDKRGNADIIVATDYAGTKLADLTASLDNLRSGLLDKDISANIKVVSDKTTVDTVNLEKSKMEIAGSNRVLLKADGSLWTWKISGGNSIIPAEMILDVYPYAQDIFKPYYSSSGSLVTVEQQLASCYIPPVKISDDVVDFAASGNALCYLKADGSVWYVGGRTVNYVNKIVHERILNFTGVKTITKMPGGFAFIKNDGTLWGMSSSISYLGRGNYETAPQYVKDNYNNLAPAQIGRLENVKIKKFCGESQCIALTTNGDVYTWGEGSSGQLGNGSWGYSSSGWVSYYSWYPSKINISNVVDIETDNSNSARSLFLKADGTLYVAGYIGMENEFSLIKTTGYYYDSMSYNYGTGKWITYRYYYAPYPTICSLNNNIITGIQYIHKGAKWRSGGNSDISIINTNGGVIWSNGYVRKQLYYYVADYVNVRPAEYTDTYAKASVAITALENRKNQYGCYEGTWNYPVQYVILDENGNVTDIKMAEGSDTSLQTKFNVSYDEIKDLLDGSTPFDVQSIDTDKLQSIQIREDADKYLIYASDTQGSYIDDIRSYLSFNTVPEAFEEYLKDNNFEFMALTPYANYDALVSNKLLGNGGIYNSFDMLAKGILSRYNIQTGESGVVYLIAGEDGLYYGNNLYYNDYENDPRYAGIWNFTHDEKYFENSNGKYAYSGQWVTDPDTYLDKVGKYDVIHKVRDNPKDVDAFDNYRLWSNEKCKFTIYVHRRPIALFSVSLFKKGSNYSYTVYNLSYDLDHASRGDRGITQTIWQWRLASASSWNDGMLPDVLSANSQYHLKLVVKDLEGASSLPYIYSIDTTNVNLPPTVDANPQTYSGPAPPDVTVTADDKGENDFLKTEYAWTDSTSMPSVWRTETSRTFITNPPGDGIWYLHMRAFDTEGKSYYVHRGPYDIYGLQIADVTISGYWNHWRGQTDIFGKRMTNEPHRFLSLERVKIDITTVGDPERVTIRFSPELEAMHYTDPNGNAYDYADDFFGYDVEFPEDSTFTAPGNHIAWEYYLPLAPSTKSMDDRRLRSQYRMTVTAYKGEASVTYTIDDIDITGNIYDLTYIQPKD